MFSVCNVSGRSYFLRINTSRFMSSKDYYEKLKKCYEILNVNESSDQETVRQAYLNLAKKYHPDSGSPGADIKKFQEIEAAFRIVTKKLSQDRWDVEESRRVEEFDIKHTAPQHRNYLSYEGSGYGSPSQREKQWLKTRADRAAQNVMEHRISKATASENALLDKKSITAQKHDIKTKYGFDRLVEDLIQESISKGEFDNLSGKGKPLPLHQNTNPYVDFVTHKMNQVLIDNGFTPAWITLQKEIARETSLLKSDLLAERSKLGPTPLSYDEQCEWKDRINKYAFVVKQINSKITHYNLVVPIIQKQMLFISLEKEATFALENGKDKTQVPVSDLRSTNSNNNDKSVLLSKHVTPENLKNLDTTQSI